MLSIKTCSLRMKRFFSVIVVLLSICVIWGSLTLRRSSVYDDNNDRLRWQSFKLSLSSSTSGTLSSGAGSSAGWDDGNDKAQQQKHQQQQQQKGVKTIGSIYNDDVRPPLSSLLAITENSSSSQTTNMTTSTKIIGNVEFLLDFCILGVANTGGDALHKWLLKHKPKKKHHNNNNNTAKVAISLVKQQVLALRTNRPDELVRLLYDLPGEQQEERQQLRRGFKALNEIRFPTSFSYLAKYWPKARLVVGIRHPILWFESSFRQEQKQAKKMIGADLPPQVFFHVHLNQMGKTTTAATTTATTTNFQNDIHSIINNKNDLRDNPEHDLLSVFKTPKILSYPTIPNPVFLYDALQPFDRDEERREAFRTDMETTVLNVTTTNNNDGSKSLQLLKPIKVDYDAHPGLLLTNDDKRSWICGPEYDRVRTDLLFIGASASEWILKYFLQSDDVHVSSQNHFERLLNTWNVDPCVASLEQQLQTTINSKTDVKPMQQQQTVLQDLFPPLDTLIGDSSTSNNNNDDDDDSHDDFDTDVIQNDIQFLLDFGLVAHAKTSTTTIIKWLSTHPEILAYSDEMHELTRNRPDRFVERLYKLPHDTAVLSTTSEAGASFSSLGQDNNNNNSSLQQQRRFKRGYKAPNDLTNAVPRKLLYKYFGQTKLIVGVRHPVSWFQSWYNYEKRRGRTSLLKSPNLYEGSANLPVQGLFHVTLAMMGKTRLKKAKKNNDDDDNDGDDDDDTEGEMELLAPYLREPIQRAKQRPMKNPVFLYDISQPYDTKNETRSDLFRQDLSDFIGLGTPLQPLKGDDDEEETDDRGGGDERKTRKLLDEKEEEDQINICDDEWDDLRADLVELGRAASKWFSTYFLPLGDVTVSSPDHFRKILESWKLDPCNSNS